MEPTPLDVLQDAVRSAFAEAGVEPLADHVEDFAISVEYVRLLETCAHYDLDPVGFWRARDPAYIHRDHNDGAAADPTYELESLHDLPDILS